MKKYRSKEDYEIAKSQMNQFINFNTRARNFIHLYNTKSKEQQVPTLSFYYSTNTHCIGQWLKEDFDSYDKLLKFFLSEKFRRPGSFGDVTLSICGHYLDRNDKEFERCIMAVYIDWKKER